MPIYYAARSADVLLAFDSADCSRFAMSGRPYGMGEALEGYKRAAATHGWKVNLVSWVHNFCLTGVADSSRNGSYCILDCSSTFIFVSWEYVGMLSTARHGGVASLRFMEVQINSHV